MTVPQAIPILETNAIASYSYTEVTSGIVTFYGADNLDDGVSGALLTTNSNLYSNTVEGTFLKKTSAGTYSTFIDKDFD